MADWTKLPGISEDGGRKNYLVGVGYVFLVLLVIGAAADPDDEEDGPEPEMTSTPSEEVATATQTPVAADGGTPAATSAPTATETATSTASPNTPTPARESELGSIQDVDDLHADGATELSGSGQTITDTFDHPGGLLVLDYQHNGESNFIVELYDEDTGERDDIPINKIGSVDGATGIPLEAGEYSLDVDADGDWAITAGSPIAPDGSIHAPPASASGEGPDVVGPIELDGTVDLTGSHIGESNFIVEIINEDGTGFAGTIAFNEIGEVDQAETRERHSGVAWVVVEADGAWELEFE